MALQTPDAPQTCDSNVDAGVIEDARRRQRRHRLGWMLPAAAVMTAGLTVAFWGASGGSGTHGLTANAEVLRQVEQATAAKPGTVVVQIIRDVSSSPGSAPGQPNPSVVKDVVETPAGRGPQNYLYSSNTRVVGVSSAYGVVNGVGQFYLRKPDTLYTSSVWGPYLKRGRKPGTFIYRPAKQTELGSAGVYLPPKPLVLSAAQAHALLDGSDTIVAGREASNVEAQARALFDPPVTFLAGKADGSRIAPVLRFPVVELWLLLKAHDLRVIGLTTVDGRRAIELAGPRAGTKPKGNPLDIYSGAADGTKVWVDAKTYAPIKETFDQFPDLRSTETWLEYKTLPITPATERLLSPLSLHPQARIDRNYNAYFKASYQSFDPQSGLPPGIP